MAQEFGAEKVIHSYCHGEKRYDDSFKGYVEGIEYKLVSGDYLNLKPGAGFTLIKLFVKRESLWKHSHILYFSG